MKVLRLFGAIATLALIALSAQPAWASSPHFVNASGSINSSGSLVVSFHIAGLGDSVTDTVTLTGDSSAVYGCVNLGQNHPQAQNKETTSGTVDVSGEFTSDRNGQITNTLTASPPPNPGLSCPGKMTVELVSVTYSNLVLSDSYGASTTVGTVSKTFFR